MTHGAASASCAGYVTCVEITAHSLPEDQLLVYMGPNVPPAKPFRHQGLISSLPEDVKGKNKAWITTSKKVRWHEHTRACNCKAVRKRVARRVKPNIFVMRKQTSNH